MFLERQSYRRRRVNDAARVLPFIGTLLWMIPLLWPENGAAVRSSSAIIYLFGVWGLLVLGAGLLSWRLSVQAREGDPERAPFFRRIALPVTLPLNRLLSPIKRATNSLAGWL